MRRFTVILTLAMISALLVACHGEVRGALPSSIDQNTKKDAKKCDKGESHACHNVAITLLAYEGATDEHLALATRLLTRACADGLGLSCRRLAEPSPKAEHSAEESMGVLRRACDRGDRGACVSLAVRHVEAGDHDRGLIDLNRLCKDGSTYGCIELGRLMFKGPPEIRNPQEAIVVLNGPCGNGAPIACRLRAEAQLSMAQSPKDITRNIIKQFGEACLAADERACRHLSGLYNEGLGVEKDPAYAQALLRRACDVPSPSKDCGVAIPPPVFEKAPAQENVPENAAPSPTEP